LLERDALTLEAGRTQPRAFTVDHLRAGVGGLARAWRLAREARQFGQDAAGQDVAAIGLSSQRRRW